MGSLSRREFLGAGLYGGALALTAGRRRTGTAHVLSGRASAAGPPPVTPTVPAAADVAPGYIFLTPTKSASYQNGPLIVDNTGKVVWFHPVTTSSANFRVQTLKGEPVMCWWQGEVILPGYGQGVYFIYDSNYQRIHRVRAANGLQGDLHEFLVSPQNTALFTVYEMKPRDLSPVGGPTDGMILDSLIQEVDIGSGELVMQWNAASHVRLDESYAPVPTNASTPFDFFHINSIDVDVDDNLIVSARHCFCVYKINRTTGKVMWRLNGKRSDFAMGEGSTFEWQHHATHLRGNQLSLFDDAGGLEPPIEPQARGLRLQLDETNMTCSLVDQYLCYPTSTAYSQGSMQVLPNNNAFVGWGSLPYLSEYAEDGFLLFAAELPTGINSYRAFRHPWKPPPV